MKVRCMFQFESGVFAEVTSCCDVHDRCYGTCGNRKEKCDAALHACVLKRCVEGEIQVLKYREMLGM